MSIASEILLEIFNHAVTTDDPFRFDNTIMQTISSIASSCSITQYAEPPSLRLTRTVGEEMEEVTVTVPGIICSKTLPPIHGPLRASDPDHVRYLRQFVRLTGLGSHGFRAQEEVVSSVLGQFEGSPEVSALDDMNFGQYEGHSCLDLHARYLTERRYAPGLPHIPFTPDIDPDHVLEELRDTKFIRIEDNIVQYSRKVDDGNGPFHYVPMCPSGFKEGDIVEAVGSFVAYPTRDPGHYRLVFCLRALTMLNSTFREDSRIKRASWLDSRKKEPRKKVKHPSISSLRRSYIPYGRSVATERSADESMTDVSAKDGNSSVGRGER
ncbi:hypothetical protein DFP72DRAFT_1071453 [Ephemerocybe angulata]|uniref:Uncharacterized protein n=1 Tax=Ephemerocybe angulata TaxID=980116 RepID=A0A8H6M3V5_9AGAR|nr:hypothetical protein DFP72DRAFT_1071453 [Tulosesus angulatus]